MGLVKKGALDGNSIQVMLRMIGYGENIGSGFPLILQAWEQKHWMRPELIEQSELMQTKLILRHSKMDEVATRNTTNGDTKDDTKELSERQKVIITLLAMDDTITIDNMIPKLGVSRITILRDLKTLRKLGKVIREGGNKNGRWIVIKD